MGKRVIGFIRAAYGRDFRLSSAMPVGIGDQEKRASRRRSSESTRREVLRTWVQSLRPKSGSYILLCESDNSCERDGSFRHQLPDRIKHRFELFVISRFEFQQSFCQLFVRFQDLTKLSECPH